MLELIVFESKHVQAIETLVANIDPRRLGVKGHMPRSKAKPTMGGHDLGLRQNAIVKSVSSKRTRLFGLVCARFVASVDNHHVLTRGKCHHLMRVNSKLEVAHLGQFFLDQAVLVERMHTQATDRVIVSIDGESTAWIDAHVDCASIKHRVLPKWSQRAIALNGESAHMVAVRHFVRSTVAARDIKPGELRMLPSVLNLGFDGDAAVLRQRARFRMHLEVRQCVINGTVQGNAFCWGGDWLQHRVTACW